MQRDLGMFRLLFFWGPYSHFFSLVTVIRVIISSSSLLRFEYFLSLCMQAGLTLAVIRI